RPVVDEGEARASEDRCRDRRRRRLAVRRRQDEAAPVEPSSKLADRVVLERDQDLAGKARAPSTAGFAREPADRAGGGNRGAEHRHRPSGTSTRTAPGTARTVAGSSAIGSPSAYIVNGRSALIVTSGTRSTSTPSSFTCSPLNTVGSSRRKRVFDTA